MNRSILLANTWTGYALMQRANNVTQWNHNIFFSVSRVSNERDFTKEARMSQLDGMRWLANQRILSKDPPHPQDSSGVNWRPLYLGKLLLEYFLYADIFFTWDLFRICDASATLAHLLLLLAVNTVKYWYKFRHTNSVRFSIRGQCSWYHYSLPNLFIV